MLYGEIITVCSEIRTNTWMHCLGSIWNVLGGLAELRKGTVSFVMSVRPSVCVSVFPHETTQLPLDGGFFFYEIRCMMILWKSVQKIQVSLKSDTNNRYFIWESMNIFKRVRKIAEKRLLASSCLSVRMEKLGSHWTDFHEILYLSIFRKSGKKI